MTALNLSRMLLVLLLILACTAVRAQTDNSISAGIASLSHKVKNSTLPEEQQTAITEQLERARIALADSSNYDAQLKQYEQDALQAQSKIAENTQQLQQIKTQVPPLSPQLSAEQLANKLVVLNAEQNTLQSRLDELQNQKSALSNRPGAIGEELNNARKSLETSKATLDKQSAAEDDLSAASVQLALRARVQSLQSQVTLLEREVATVPARQALLDSQIELLNTQLDASKNHVQILQAQLEKSRAGDVSQLLAKAEQDVSGNADSEALAQLATDNLGLARSLQTMVEAEPAINDSIARLKQQRQTIQQSAQTVGRVLATGQITDELGVLLHRLRSGLPLEKPLQQRLEQIDEESVHKQLNMILWQDKLRSLTEDYPVTSQNLSKNMSQTQPQAQTKRNSDKTGPAKLTTEQQARLRGLQENQITLLKQLIDSASAGIDKLTDEKLIVSEVAAQTSELKTLLDRRLVWLPSYSKLTDNIMHNLAVSLDWYTDGGDWLRVTGDLWRGVEKKPLLTLIVLLISCSIFAFRGTIKKSLLRLSGRIGKVGQDTYWATPVALLETLILALPLPLMISALAVLILIGEDSASFSVSVATALGAVSSLSLTLLFFRSLCRRNGIFVAHFGWSNAAREQLGHLLTMFVWYQGVATFVFASAIASGKIELRYGIAIFAFIAMSIGISLFSFRFFKPKTGVVASSIGPSQRYILLNLAFALMVIAPLFNGFLPLIGFFDTAVELQSKLFQSVVVLIFVSIFYGILLRIFAVAIRRYLLRKTKLRRAKKEQQRVQQEQADASGEAMPVIQPEEIPDDKVISKKLRSSAMAIASLLFLVGLWYIWLPLLPALGIVNEITLWQKTTLIDGIEVSDNVTLWNIILALGLIIGGFVAAKNSRGILELSYFERVSLDAGARYAAVTVFGYLILGTSIVLGFSQLGIDWSKLQWIVAALGVGLGFGLQEIVANFVSGLIILFERPVRVGDTVTIGNLSGTVSNIKIRATTITDFENREVLLPNKAIITENVTNWTLGNAITRLLIPIGVAYGSNPTQVRELLLKVLEQHPDVLSQPAPSVFFVSHGESSLDFEMRLFVDTPGKRLPVTHDINTLINETLSQHNIEIPFPQRDIHIIGQSPLAGQKEKENMQRKES